jgi:hypothetical protein
VAALLRECAFTTLNRLVALKMLEAREIVQPCVSQGPLSSGFKQFCGLAPGLVDLPDQGYRLYLDSLFDEIGREVRVLFDRRDPASLLWPRKTALDELLGLLNDPALAGVWGEDETIGWVYQYFNGEDERRQMRAESQAPRNSRELAVRNQFFTPRYVVKFLTDNTLGRTWVEQRRGDTRLVETCRYLVRRPGEGFGASGEAAEHSSTTPSPVRQLAEHPSTSPNPARHLAEHSSTSPSPARHLAEHSSTSPNPSRQSAEPSSTTPSPSRQSAEPSSTAPTPPSPVAFRAKKDPRDLRVLDPACGSGHFLLYSFDLLLVIYEEAWADADSPASEATGHTLVADYPSLDALRRALPGLVLRHNLYGVDIDPRAAQIAAFALWMRAQRAWNALGLKRADRPLVTRTNVVVAEPMPGEPDLLTELCQRLDKPVADIVRAVFVEMKLAGEAGMLLRVEDTVRRGVERLTELGGLYADQDARRWERLEAKVYDALRDYAESVGGVGYRRRLFADDAAQGFAFIELCRQTYDVVLMNPPFGEASVNSRPVIADQYLEWNSNILCAFVIAGIRMCGEDGTIGAVLDQTALVKSTYQEFRRTTMLSRECSGIVVGLGWGVLDASVEVSALCLRSGQGKPFLINSLSHTMSSEHPTELQSRCHTTTGWHEFEAELIGRLPNSALPLSMPPWLIPAFVSLPTFSEICGTAVQGHSLRSAEHFRAFWEVAPNQEISASGPYSTLYNGGEHSYYASPLRDICRYRIKGGGLYSEHVVLRNLSLQGQPGIGWGKRGDYLDAHIMPRGSIFTVEGQGLPSPMRPWLALALLNSTVASLLLSQYCGQHKYSGYVNLCPTPALDDSTRATIEELAFEAWQHVANAWSSDETTPYFNGLNLSDFDSPTQWAHRRASESAMLAQATHVARQKIERCLHLAYGLDSSATDAIREWAVSEPKILNTGPWADGSTEPAWWLRRLISALLGRALGGMSDAQLMQAPQRLTCERAFASVEYHRDDSTQHTNAYLVDDPGHPDDIELAISKVLRFDGESDPATTAAISLGYATLRDYLRNRMFEDHLLAFQGGRRPAPIYWRLGTPSGAYSVWVYLHRVGPDTLHAALRDHVAPKLRYEEDSLGQLTAEAGPTPSTAQRRASPRRRALWRSCGRFATSWRGWPPCGAPTSTTAW